MMKEIQRFLFQAAVCAAVLGAGLAGCASSPENFGAAGTEPAAFVVLVPWDEGLNTFKNERDYFRYQSAKAFPYAAPLENAPTLKEARAAYERMGYETQDIILSRIGKERERGWIESLVKPVIKEYGYFTGGAGFVADGRGGFIWRYLVVMDR